MTILRPRNMEQLIAQVKALPTEKRKTLIFVGRHAHEGTINIAIRHHKDWEKHGAAVIRIPAIWTPHYYWKKVVQEVEKGGDSKDSKLVAEAKAIISDEKIIETLAAQGITPPVINFHGIDGGLEEKYALQINLHPGAPASIRKAAIIAIGKLETETRSALKIVNKNTLVRLKGLLSKHPNEITVEHIYRGKPATKARRAAEIKAQKSGDAGYNFQTFYINKQRRITREDLTRFHEELSAQFEELVKQITQHAEPVVH